jgi:hypothetical protein
MKQAALQQADPGLIARLKTDLAALGAMTEVGFETGGADVDRLKVLAAELEALNPTPEPARAQALLKGRWHLIYSSFGLLRETTLAALTFGILPKTPVTVVEIFQETDPATGHYDNVLHFIGEDGEPGVLVAEGDYRVEEDATLDIRFEHAIVTSSGHRAVFALDNGRLPPIRTDISFLDDGFRLMRGANGSLYILERLDPQPIRWAREAP